MLRPIGRAAHAAKPHRELRIRSRYHQVDDQCFDEVWALVEPGYQHLSAPQIEAARVVVASAGLAYARMGIRDPGGPSRYGLWRHQAASARLGHCMTDRASDHTGGWMVEVMGDGPRERHKRYLVNAANRDELPSPCRRFWVAARKSTPSRPSQPPPLTPPTSLSDKWCLYDGRHSHTFSRLKRCYE